MTRPSGGIARLTARPGGLVRTRDLRASGLSPDEAKWAIRGLYQIRRGAYALQPPSNERERHALFVRAVVLDHQNLVAASHVSAAVLHDLPLWGVPLDTAHVMGFEPVRRGIRHGVHTYESLVEYSEVVDVIDIPVTTVPRTVLDCARVLPLDRAVAMADHALHQNLADASDLELRTARLSTVTGIDRVRRVIELADGRAESPGESWTRLVVVEAGIPVDPQVVVCDSRGRFIARVDLKVRGHFVVIEFDGRSKYSLNGDVEQAHWDEKKRFDALTDAGFVVVRVTWEQLRHPEQVVARVREAIARARRLHG